MLDVFSKHYPHMHCHVVANYASGELFINQPQWMGGRIETTLDAYDEFEGDMTDFIIHLRDTANG